MPLRFSISLIASASIIGIGTLATYTHLFKNPTVEKWPETETRPNGGEPITPGITQQDIEDEIRSHMTSFKEEQKQATHSPEDPEVIVPQKAIVNTEDAGKQVIREKILEALRNSQVRVRVNGTMDKDGDVDLGKFSFVIKGGKPAVPTAQTPQEKKPERQLTNKGRQA